MVSPGTVAVVSPNLGDATDRSRRPVLTPLD
jgi:hypothetical protein